GDSPDVFIVLFLFFFQAEDGIRDFHVTGVQTCALPIWGEIRGRRWRRWCVSCSVLWGDDGMDFPAPCGLGKSIQGVMWNLFAEFRVLGCGSERVRDQQKFGLMRRSRRRLGVHLWRGRSPGRWCLRECGVWWRPRLCGTLLLVLPRLGCEW